MNIEKSAKELLQEGFEIISPAQKEAKRKYVDRLKSNEQFVMVKGGFAEVKSHLSLEQSGVLMLLMSFVKLNEDGNLYIEKNRKLERMTTTDIADLIGKTKSQANRVLSELEALSLIERNKEGRNVYVSLGASFFNCGIYEGKERFVKVYKTHLKDVAKQLTLSELGLLMLLLTHVHYKTHLLVDNPEESDPSKLVIWQRKHIAEELGCSIDFVKRAIPKLRKVKALMEIKATKTGILMSPALACKQAYKPKLEDIQNYIDECSFSKDNFKE
ncbi:helix-turn-helix transcriptional regulator [Bacillus mycoides]|uniref:helix-turn-helix transcriptional regulator n=1 Tax=Bacillus mycoides TaxID=1405 RepID=UPI003D662BFF